MFGPSVGTSSESCNIGNPLKYVHIQISLKFVRSKHPYWIFNHFGNFAESMKVILPCFEINFKTTGQHWQEVVDKRYIGIYQIKIYFSQIFRQIPRERSYLFRSAGKSHITFHAYGLLKHMFLKRSVFWSCKLCRRSHMRFISIMEIPIQSWYWNNALDVCLHCSPWIIIAWSSSRSNKKPIEISQGKT